MDLPKKSFYFMRHGETDYNAKKILAGSEADIPLNSRGKTQARLARSFIKELAISGICHSPMLRAKQTMEIATRDHAVERLSVETLKECKSATWMKMATLDHGGDPHEEVLEFFDRVEQGIKEALTSFESPILIVAHGGLHYALCHQLKIENHNWRMSNCAITHFWPEENLWRAESLYSLPDGAPFFDIEETSTI